MRHRTALSVRVFVALALVPPLYAAAILWVAPVEATDAPRAALAGRDFTALWAAGRSVIEGVANSLADPALFSAWIRHLFGPGMPDQIWPYPPTALLLAAPLAHLPLTTALVLYLTASSLLLWGALRAAEVDSDLAALVLFSPAALSCALAGQNGILLAAAVLAGLATLERRPLGSGVLLSITAIKPQFGLLLPVTLLGGKYWRALWALAGASTAVLLTSLACFGPLPWLDYVETARGAVWSYLSQPWADQGSQRLFASAFMLVRAWGGGLRDAAAVQAAVTLACVCLAWRCWRGRLGSSRDRIALSLALMLLAAPWVHSYDGVALACAVALLFREANSAELPFLAAGWLLPGLVLSPPPAGLQMLATCGVANVAWRRLEGEARRCSAS